MYDVDGSPVSGGWLLKTSRLRVAMFASSPLGTHPSWSARTSATTKGTSVRTKTPTSSASSRPRASRTRRVKDPPSAGCTVRCLLGQTGLEPRAHAVAPQLRDAAVEHHERVRKLRSDEEVDVDTRRAGSGREQQRVVEQVVAGSHADHARRQPTEVG